MSPALAFLGISILGTWGLASIGLIAGGVIMLFFPGDPTTSSSNTLGGIVLIAAGVISAGLMQVTLAPLLGLDPPIPMRAKNILPFAKLTRWTKAGNIRDFPDGTPKEIRLRSQRVLIIRQGDTVAATTALCSHARLPLAGLPGSPIKPVPIQDGCITCPFHGAKFEVTTGRVIRQPFDSAFNNDHPFLGRVQSKLFRVLSAPPTPSFVPKPSMKAEDMQIYPVKIEAGEVMVALPR